jgi:hypothetical protein
MTGGPQHEPVEQSVQVPIEPRWPVAATISFYIALTIVLRVAEPTARR